MRSATTSSQAQALANPKDLSTHLRVSVDDGSGNYQDLTDLEGYNWVDSVTYEEASGKPVATAKVKLKREAHKLSLSPFMDGSKLNVGGTVIDIARKILIETAVLPRGKQPASNEWEKVFPGYIEKIALAKSPVVLSCQDLGAELLRRFIETQRVYAETDNALHEVIQDIVDDTSPEVESVDTDPTYDWDGTTTFDCSDTSGVAVGDFIGLERSPYFEITGITANVDITIDNAGGRTIPTSQAGDTTYKIPVADRITLYVEGANPAWAIHEYYQSKDRVLTAIRKLAQQIGYEVSYRWNTGTSAFELTLWTPDRAAVTPDVTIGPGVFKDIQKFDQDRSKIRNAIKTTAMVAGVKTTVIRTDATSIAKYGRCYMEATEKSSSQIDTLAELQDFGDIILDDLKEPEADLSGSMPYRWDIQPAAYARFEADGVRFDTNQDMGIVSLKHTIPNTGEAKTVASVRGKPGGGVNRWLEIEGMPGVAAPIDHKSDAAPAGTGSSPAALSIIIEFDDPRTMSPAVDDWAYSRVYTHTADPGSPPNVAYLVAVGRQTRFEIGGLLPGTLYHSRIEHVDEAGNVGNVSGDVQETTQSVGAYHENSETVRGNLINNGDFGQTTLDISSNPPDGWFVDSGDAWGAADELYYSAALQETGARSVHFRPSGGGKIIGAMFPVEADTLYDFTASVRADVQLAGARWIKIGINRYDASKAFLDAPFWTIAEVSVINTWEVRRTKLYATDGEPTCRFVEPWVEAANQNFNAYCDRYSITRGRQSFAAYRNAAQVINDVAWTKVGFDVASFDYDNVVIGATTYGFETANSRYRILQAGQYSFEARVGLSALADQTAIVVAIYLNGVEHRRGNRILTGALGDVGSIVAVILDIDKGDFVEVFVRHNHGAARNLLVGATQTWFTGGRIE